MKKIQLLILSILFISFQSCSKDETIEDIDPSTGQEYKVSFNLSWSSADFPTDYPSNPHFSKLIGITHNNDGSIHSVGQMASPGIKLMAETGGTTTLSEEIRDIIDAGNGHDLILGSGLSSGTGTIEVNIKVTKDFPLVSLTTMIAPSPDWYVGIDSVSMLEDGEFIEELTIEMKAYDAGTDSGTTFTSANSPTNPQENISYIITAPLGNGTALVASIGSIVFEKL